MNRSLARRYAPLIGIVAIQLLIVALAPSKSGGDDALEFTAGADPRFSGGVVDPETGQLVDPETGELLDPGAGGDLGATGDTGASGATPTGDAGATGAPGQATPGGGGGGGGGGQSGGGAVPAGDTKHCRNNRQFDGMYYAPPCVPKFAGDNGGGTYRGVSGDTVVVVRYNTQSDPAVDALLKSQGLASSNEEEEAFEAAAEKFINERYELWGRKIDLRTYNGTCDTLPPREDCFREDMRKLVQKEQPFAVIWDTPIANFAFDELSAQKVVNLGGWHFSDGFNSARRPFHYDTMISGSRVVQHLGEYWCKRLAGKPAKYAGDPTMATKPRRLGIISPNTNANRDVVNELKGMVANCGGGVVSEFYYDQDIDRANEQRKAGVAKMRGDGVTTIACICDGIAPYFLVITCDEDRYYPEHILAGTGEMDSDAIGRLYQKSTQMDSFFGISSLAEGEPYSANDAARVWKATGNQGDPPYNRAAATWRYYELVAGAIQMAGPTLNPASFEAGTHRVSRATDGPLHETRAWGRNDFAGIDDAREVYWSSTAISKLDGRPGTWVSLNGGKRYLPGQWPAGEPALPAQRG